MATRKKKAVWDKPVPRKSKHTKLSSSQKAAAKACARRAGRPYPNLVDNMRAAKKSVAKKKSSAGKKSGASGQNKRA